jgi:reactive intermediate/imine deaminase
MNKSFIATANAPAAIGTYSQAVKVGQTTYLSGQIPLIPESMALVEGNIEAEVRQAFTNLKAVCEAAGGSLNHLVKVNVFLTDLTHFPVVNQVMEEISGRSRWNYGELITASQVGYRSAGIRSR